ncbi:MAG: hemerythrin domain-containing protein [Bacteroidales bacterium]
MHRYQYPGFTLHKKEHDEFIKKVNEIAERVKTGKLVISIEITNMIKEWIENHIRKTDKEYSAYLLSHGVH